MDPNRDGPCGKWVEGLDDTTTSGDLLPEEGVAVGGMCSAEDGILYGATSDLTKVATKTSPDPSPPVMLGARPKGSNASVDSCQIDF